MSREFFWGLLLLHLLADGGYVWALTGFFGRRLKDARGGRGGRIAFAGALTGALLVMGAVQEIWYIPFFLAAAIRHALLIGLVMLFFMAEPEKKLFGAVLAMTVEVLAGNFGNSLLSMVTLCVRKWFMEGENASVSLWGNALPAVLARGGVILAVCLSERPLGEIFSGRMKRWYVLLSLPLLFIVAVVDLVNYGASVGIMVVSDVNGPDYWNEYDNEIFSHLGICIVTALSMCAAGVYVSGMNRIWLEQQKKERYRSQLDFYRLLEEQYGQMERLRHDMKNHLIALTGLWKNREWNKMGDYLTRMQEAGDFGEEEATGSRAVDALLCKKRRQAEEQGIRWECDVRIPRDCPADEFDLCVLMGNLLDNALTGAQSYVRIRAGAVKKCFLLEVENNSPGGGLQGDSLRNAGKVRYSTKKNPGEHGIGLLNVRGTVEKYDGIMNVEAGDGIFAVSLLLPPASFS